MARKLEPREKRTLVICGAGALLLMIYFLLLEPILGDWKQVRSQLKTAHQQLDKLQPDEKSPTAARQRTLIEMVPAMEMPGPAELQGPLFQESLTEQIQRAGLKSKRMQLAEAKGAVSRFSSGYRVLSVQSQGQGRYEQIIELLASLPKNPRYVGIQKLVIQVDPQKREQIEWDLAVFTYAAP